ncbi:hypothetical protein HEP_00526200, partial [Hepatocystis sp. ex Piliocolobus tephrosceles]
KQNDTNFNVKENCSNVRYKYYYYDDNGALIGYTYNQSNDNKSTDAPKLISKNQTTSPKNYNYVNVDNFIQGTYKREMLPHGVDTCETNNNAKYSPVKVVNCERNNNIVYNKTVKVDNIDNNGTVNGTVDDSDIQITFNDHKSETKIKNTNICIDETMSNSYTKAETKQIKNIYSLSDTQNTLNDNNDIIMNIIQTQQDVNKNKFQTIEHVENYNNSNDYSHNNKKTSFSVEPYTTDKASFTTTTNNICLN